MCLPSLFPVNLCQTTERSHPCVLASEITTIAHTSSENIQLYSFESAICLLWWEAGRTHQGRWCCHHALSAPGCLISAVWENDVISDSQAVDSFCSFTYKKKPNNNIISQYFHYVYFHIPNKTFAKSNAFTYSVGLKDVEVPNKRLCLNIKGIFCLHI